MPKAREVLTLNNFTLNNRDFYDSETYTLRDIVEGMGYDLGLTDYPIFDESYREHLNSAIIEHFWYRRIASDTPSIFIFYLNRKMRENMPTYNAIYKRMQAEKIDPLATNQGWTESQSNTATHSDEKGDSGSTATTINSSTPQVNIANPQGLEYMDALTKSDSTAASTGTTDGTANSASDGYWHNIENGIASSVRDIIDSSFIATDTLVFTMLEPLFMQVLADEPY